MIINTSSVVSTVEWNPDAQLGRVEVGVPGLLDGLLGELPAGVVGAGLVVGHRVQEVHLAIHTQLVQQPLLRKDGMISDY